MIRLANSLIVVLILAWSLTAFPQALSTGKPGDVGMSSERLKEVHRIINEAIDKEHIPGAVILVARESRIVMRRAYGFSQIKPSPKAMKPEMIFDLASITKPMATAVSMMILVENGMVRLQDRVRDFVPRFSRYRLTNGNLSGDARLYHLLTHTSGLPPYYNADSLMQRYGYVCSIDSAASFMGSLEKSNPPGQEFHYSCLGFITQANIIKQITGLTLDEFSHKYIFKPLGMRQTGFIPQIAESQPDPTNRLVKDYPDLIVPTEMNGETPFLGTVHDPLARALGGISGNAGLFSNVDDMAIFAQMMLNEGEYEGVRIISPLSVRLMTSIYPSTSDIGRGLGWDIASAYSSNGGDLFPAGGYGHTGYTGTSIWISPQTKTFVILLTNRVHPEDKNGAAVIRLRSRVANIVAASIIE